MNKNHARSSTRVRARVRLGAAVAMALVTTVMFAQAPASKRWTQPRTPDGQPDLQGTWVNFDDTPFESSGPGRKPSEVNPPEHWADHASPTSKARASMVIEPKTGVVPLLKSAEETRDFHLARVGDAPEHETPWVRCITRGIPGGMLPAQYNNGYQIVQAPGYVVIRYEMIHEARIIPIDGRPHLPAGVRQWTGDSRGRFEGDTLVVETTNQIPHRHYYGVQMLNSVMSDEFRVVERFTRTAPDQIRYRATVHDPVFTAPWTVEIFMHPQEGELVEFACHEGNYGLSGILSATREEERRAREEGR